MSRWLALAALLLPVAGSAMDAQAALTAMHEWYCKGAGMEHWQGTGSAHEDQEMCDMWYSWIDSGPDPSQRTMPDHEPPTGAVWRLHRAWCELHPSPDTESIPCKHYRERPEFAEKYKPEL